MRLPDGRLGAAVIGPERVFVVEKPGLIKIYQNGGVRPDPFLDISGKISTSGEQGLLSMATCTGEQNILLFMGLTSMLISAAAKSGGCVPMVPAGQIHYWWMPLFALPLLVRMKLATYMSAISPMV